MQLMSCTSVLNWAALEMSVLLFSVNPAVWGTELEALLMPLLERSVPLPEIDAAAYCKLPDVLLMALFARALGCGLAGSTNAGLAGSTTVGLAGSTTAGLKGSTTAVLCAPAVGVPAAAWPPFAACNTCFAA